MSASVRSAPQFVGTLNPWSGMELPSLPARKQRWRPEQIPLIVEKAREVGRPSLGLATLAAYWLGHRQGDLLSLTWTQLEDQEKETSKTSAEVPIAASAYPELAAALAETPRVSEYVIPHEGTQTRWNRYTFTHEWRLVARAAGIPDGLQFRDLRATAVTEMADTGVDARGSVWRPETGQGNRRRNRETRLRPGR